MKKISNPAPPSIDNKPPAPSAPPSATHVHCEECCSPHCYGIQAREALPAKEPSPEWMQRARLEGRAEFVELLLRESAESFCDEYTTSHPIADTGDFGVEWDRHKLADLFEVNENAASLIDRVDGAYWSQQAAIDDLILDRGRLEWLQAHPNAIQHSNASGFCYWPAGRGAMISGKSLREVIDRAIRAANAERGAR